MTVRDSNSLRTAVRFRIGHASRSATPGVKTLVGSCGQAGTIVTAARRVRDSEIHDPRRPVPASVHQRNALFWIRLRVVGARNSLVDLTCRLEFSTGRTAGRFSRHLVTPIPPIGKRPWNWDADLAAFRTSIINALSSEHRLSPRWSYLTTPLGLIDEWPGEFAA